MNRCRCIGGPPSLTPSVLRYVTEEEQRPAQPVVRLVGRRGVWRRQNGTDQGGRTHSRTETLLPPRSAPRLRAPAQPDTRLSRGFNLMNPGRPFKIKCKLTRR